MKIICYKLEKERSIQNHRLHEKRATRMDELANIIRGQGVLKGRVLGFLAAAVGYGLLIEFSILLRKAASITDGPKQKHYGGEDLHCDIVFGSAQLVKSRATWTAIDLNSGARGEHDDASAGEAQHGPGDVPSVRNKLFDEPHPKHRSRDVNAAVGRINPACPFNGMQS